MKKLLTVTLVFVFALALVLAIGCSQKEPAMDSGAGMDQATPSSESGMMMDTTGAMMSAPDTTAAGSGQ